jgi:hypothetical protein
MMDKPDTIRINGLKKQLEECKRSPWNSLALLVIVLSACAIFYNFFIESHLWLLVAGIVAASLSVAFWVKLRRAYVLLAATYEAVLDAAEST